MKKLSLSLVALTGSLILFASCSKKTTFPVEGVKETPEAADAPVATWKEHWFDHNQTVKRVFYDADVAIYYDGDVDPKITWPFKYIGDVWRYTKKTYGSLGPDPRLYAIFHTNKYGGGHPAYYYDKSHDNRNVIDCGPGPWLTQAGNIDMPTHEVFHIVESATHNTQASVGFGDYPNGIWGDSKFSEIYQYDVYLGLGLTDEAKRWHDQVINGAASYPKAGAFWFRDWLYPWYNNYGKTTVLSNFFKLIADNFPKDSNNKFTRKMNWGEYIHFSSGAAKTDLKSMAESAFGWKAQWKEELLKAKADFPNVKY